MRRTMLLRLKDKFYFLSLYLSVEEEFEKALDHFHQFQYYFMRCMLGRVSNCPMKVINCT